MILLAVIACGLLSIVYAIWATQSVLAADQGNQRMITDVIEQSFATAGITGEQIDWFVPHQANRRIIEASAKKLGIPEEKVVITVDRHANTSSASIPLALAVAVRDGRIGKGDLVLLEAMGGGFTWGALLVRW